MRIKVKDPKIFFEEVLVNTKINLKQLSKKVKINYSTLKQYRRGELLLPGELFELLIKFSKDYKYWKENSQELDNEWGTSKGGKIAASKDPDNKRLTIARKSRKNIVKSERMVLDLSNKFFWEFYGALLGDGCISKFKRNGKKEITMIYISGNKKLDHKYLEYLKEKLLSNFQINSYLYNYKDRNLCVLMICKKSFSLLLNDLGFPFGRKYGKLSIPANINWEIQKQIIKGYFDTDGSIYAKKGENYRYPHICLTSKDEKLLKQFSEILKTKGYPCYLNSGNLVIRGNKNIQRWFEEIGSSNNRNLFKYKYWIKSGTLPKNLGS